MRQFCFGRYGTYFLCQGLLLKNTKNSMFFWGKSEGFESDASHLTILEVDKILVNFVDRARWHI